MPKRIFMLWLCFLAVQAYSQEATRPTWKVGDKWLVERFDLWKKEVTDTSEHRIAEISKSSLTTEVKNPVSGQVVTWIRDLDGNTLQFAGRKFDAPIVEYSFPLKLGKKWVSKFGGPNRADPGTFTEDRACEVLAFEDVITKAEKFKAYKIKCDGTYRSTGSYYPQPYSGQVFVTVWYSPEVRHFVKREYKSVPPGGPARDQYIDQLVSFELQK